MSRNCTDDDETVFRVRVEQYRHGGRDDLLLTGVESNARFETELAAERAASAYQRNAQHVFDVGPTDDVVASVVEHKPIPEDHPLVED